METHFFYLSYADAQRIPVLGYARLTKEKKRQALRTLFDLGIFSNIFRADPQATAEAHSLATEKEANQIQSH